MLLIIHAHIAIESIDFSFYSHHPSEENKAKLIIHINPSNAEATFVLQSTRSRRFLKTYLNPVMFVFIGLRSC